MPAERWHTADCASNWGVFKIPASSGGTWTQMLHGSEGPATCDCPSFTYFKGEPMDRNCKHLDLLWNGGACLYNPQWKDGTYLPEFTPVAYTEGVDGMFIPGQECPACRGPMVPVVRAV